MKNAKEMQDAITLTKERDAEEPPAASQEHQLQREGSRKERVPSYRCGGSNHMSAQCRFAGKTCFKCGKLGHIGRVCRSKAAQQPAVRMVGASSPEPEEP